MQRKRNLLPSNEAVVATLTAFSERGSLLSAFEVASLSAAICRTPMRSKLPKQYTDMLRLIDLHVTRLGTKTELLTGAGRVLFTIEGCSAGGQQPCAKRVAARRSASRASAPPRLKRTATIQA